MHRYTRTLAALVGAASLTLAACGGDDSSRSDDGISAADVDSGSAQPGGTKSASDGQTAATGDRDHITLEPRSELLRHNILLRDPSRSRLAGPAESEVQRFRMSGLT